MCKRKDCIYHMPYRAQHDCNYIFVTGESKVGGMPKGEKYSVEDCPYYQSGIRVKARKESPIATPNNIRVISGLRVLKGSEETALKMYESGMNDVDMAKAYGVSARAMARWRKQRNLKANRKKSIDWEGVEDALKQGYSRKAVSRLYDMELCAVEIYAERRQFDVEEGQLEG